MTPPRELLERLPASASLCVWYPLRVEAGFSGATVWRGEFDGEPVLALKRYPEQFPLERLQQLHSWWKLAEHFPFVPKLHGTFERWELASWMPGAPVRSFESNDPKLDVACAAVLQLHDIWKPFRTTGPIPAIRRRIELLQSWVPSGERHEAERLLLRHRPEVIDSLQAWHDRSFPLQPVLADVHAGHVLFTGDAVTGVIDFGAMKVDHVAVDAARYLGDTCDGHGEAFQRGCDLFTRHHGENACPPELVELLDRSGKLAAIAYWLIRNDRRPEATARLSLQIERWHRLMPMP